MKKIISKMGALTGCASSLTLLAAVLASQNAAAHGYLNDPPSRAFACKQKLNKDCGAAEYEPQSVGEAPKGFPLYGPADGQIASGGTRGDFAALDIQSANRWYLTEIKDRSVQFDWFYTAAHKSTKWEYFITKTGWNPNQALSRSSFESSPFCEVQGNGQVPIDGPAGGHGPASKKHECIIPEGKTGQHVVLAMWTVDDTAAAFHDVVDVNITAEGVPPDGWSNVGTIAPTQTLLVGDKVKARAFTGSTESTQYSVEISIDSAEEGKPQNWAFKLAEQVNKTQTLVRAGVRDEQGAIGPVKGTNNLFAKKESGVTRFELALEMQEDTGARMNFGGLGVEYKLEKGIAKVSFPVVNNRTMNIEATIFDANNKEVGFTRQLVAAQSNVWLNVDVRTEPGKHGVKLVGTTEDGRTTRQAFEETEMTGEGGGGDHDFVFPENFGSYTAGTKVLQPKDGLVYECKPFPSSGYCIQYSPSANQFEPGVGSHWHMAWDKK
ncbi:N-acetylglucosamine-binding protein GbpA [Pseudomonas fluorescens]|uniref:GlcNAc-binding protein A n=1 Tax=Pseudomonas fluorescens TaxID=294 RepID=A0A5E7A8K8_PSEFL|nr:GlcNAc-binding protein A [Pseudomonas fluorescens]